MENVKLSKDELIEYAKVFHETAYKANSYLLVLEQFGENVNKFNDQINVSPSFYVTVYFAFIGQLFLELGKLYDTRKDCYTLQELVSQISQNIELFPKNEEIEYDNWHCIDTERRTFVRETAIDVIEKQPDLDFKKLLEQYEDSRKKMQKIYIRRSTQYAHNVKGIANHNRSFSGDFIENIEELKTIINFVFEIADFVITELTGLIPAREVIGYDDWIETLRLVKEQQLNVQSNDEWRKYSR